MPQEQEERAKPARMAKASAHHIVIGTGLYRQPLEHDEKTGKLVSKPVKKFKTRAEARRALHEADHLGDLETKAAAAKAAAKASAAKAAKE